MKMCYKTKSRVSMALTLAALAALLSGCCQSIQFQRLAPPKYDLSGGQRLAVLDFKPYPRDPQSGSAVARNLEAKLSPTGFYRMVERSQLSKLREEQYLGETDIIDSSTAIRAGKILGAQYVIVGEVTSFDVEDDRNVVYKQRQEFSHWTYDANGNQIPVYRTVDYPVTIITRRASVAATIRMVDAENGRQIVVDNPSRDWNEQVEAAQAGRLPSFDRMLNQLTDQITGDFSKLIAPYPVSEQRCLEGGKSPECKQGVELAKSNLWRDAQAQWRRAAEVKPEDPAPHYNLSVGAQVFGDFESAVVHIDEAMRRQNSRKYMTEKSIIIQLKTDLERRRNSRNQ